MRPIVFRRGSMDGWHSVYPNHRTTRRLNFTDRSAGVTEVYERAPFVGGQVPNPIEYQLVEREELNHG